MTKMDEVTLIMEEYKRLSDEIGRTLINRITIIGLGLAAQGAILGLTSNELRPISVGFIVPCVAFLTIFLWASEVRRGRRASWYLWGLERRINEKMGEYVLRWEEEIRPYASSIESQLGTKNQSRDKKPKKLMSLFREHYYVILGFFSIIASGSAYFGTSTLPLNWARIVWSIVVFAAIFMPSFFQIRSLEMYDYEEDGSVWPASKRSKIEGKP
ncbi:MAG: hypothetical protein ABIH70_03945 [Chloroflexota bacterium]